MIGVILAAGMASRLRPLTDAVPKCLLTVGECSLLQRTIDALLECGVRQIVMVLGYRGQQIRDFISEHYPDLDVFFIDNTAYNSTNNIFSLWLTREQTEGRDFVLLDSDILFDSRVLKAVLEDANPNVLALNCHQLGEEEIKVVANGQRDVLEISKVCSIADAAGESVGIEKISPEYSTALFAELEKMIVGEGLDNVFYEKAFERLIPQGYMFRYVDTSEFFSIELDTVEDFKNANDLISAKII